jgi:hypothetical protein
MNHEVGTTAEHQWVWKIGEPHEIGPSSDCVCVGIECARCGLNDIVDWFEMPAAQKYVSENSPNVIAKTLSSNAFRPSCNEEITRKVIDS